MSAALAFLAGAPVAPASIEYVNLRSVVPSAVWDVDAFVDVPRPTITRSNGTISLSWQVESTNFVLETAQDLSLGWQWETLPEVTSVAGAETTVTFPATNQLQFFRVRGPVRAEIPLFRFAIFHAGQLEFTWCAPLVIRGPVHASGPICLGPSSASSLRFESSVATASSIVYSNLGGYSVANMTGPVTYSGSPPLATNAPILNLPVITNDYRVLIEMPPSDESPTSLIGQQRYVNKAAVVLLVSNSTVTLTVKNKGAGLNTGVTESYNWAFTNMSLVHAHLPFLHLTNRFRDQRESKWVMPTQIDMGRLKDWLMTNEIVRALYPGFVATGPYPNILFVADFRTLTNLHAVRLHNGSVIPTNGPSHAQASGFTVATPNPLYLWGHYNSPNPAQLGTTNTIGTFPASLVSDALTILSVSWNDSQSSLSYTARIAGSTTVNAAIISGVVYSTGTAAGQWSGGFQNIPRLLERWDGRVLTMNMSMVNLYPSVRANTPFQNPGVYYSAPTRNFNFDQNFRDVTKLPPGTPMLVWKE